MAKAQVLSAQAAVQQAEKQLKNCTIVPQPPESSSAKKPNWAATSIRWRSAPPATSAKWPICKDLEVELDIQERDISRVTAGQRCRIMPEAGQHDDAFLKTHPNGYDGVVSRRMPVANRAKGAVTVRVKVEIPEQEPSGEYLLPDMGVLVSFLK